MYYLIRSEADINGFHTKVEETNPSKETPMTHSGITPGHGAYCVIIVDDESKIDAAKFKCNKYVIDAIKNLNQCWKKIYEHVEEYIT